MQKAVFLLTQRGPAEWRGLYGYEPYNWGPYSGALTSDLTRLLANDQILVEQVAGSQYGQYRSTSKGIEDAAQTWNELSGVNQSFIGDVRKYVTSKSFSALLKEIYAAYPEFAEKSLFTG